jgi:hypothetical protein
MLLREKNDVEHASAFCADLIINGVGARAS